MSTTRITRWFNASPAAVYRALIDPAAVQQWMVPEGMSSEVHVYEAWEGGRFRISLTYEEPTAAGQTGAGKTTAHTDTYHGTFVKLVPNKLVAQVLEFESTDPRMQGEMTVTFTLAAEQGGTKLIAVHDHVPPGVALADNETGWRMSLDKLAGLVEKK